MQKRSLPPPPSLAAMDSIPSHSPRMSSRVSLGSFAPHFSSSRESLLPSQSGGAYAKADVATEAMICGVPLKYVSLFTLAIQNAALSIVMHYSRVSMPASKSYSPAAAVLLNELFKGAISFFVALARTPNTTAFTSRRTAAGLERTSLWLRLNRLSSEIFAPDCWKLSIPAILYVIQNSLQFVAISNLPVASFQVAYQMKIMTTAAFSVALLRKRLNKTKWMSLLLLAVGVGIVQIQTSTGNGPPKVQEAVGSAAAAAPKHIHVMFPLKGFVAVIAACFTSGLAGVYFEMVLKNSKTDLWVRNVQLSLFSLIPALLPIIFSPSQNGSGPSHGFFVGIFRNFGLWAWATVAIQVFGGLITAIVIKYSDNIMKGFATSLSIILSFLASVVLFDFCITPTFLFGASVVLAATWMYNQPTLRESGGASAAGIAFTLGGEKDAIHVITSPLGRSDPIIGEKSAMRHSGSDLGSGLSSLASSSQSLSSLFTLGATAEKERLAREREEEFALLSSATRASSHSQFSVNPSPYLSRSSLASGSETETSEPSASPVSLHTTPFGQRRL